MYCPRCGTGVIEKYEKCPECNGSLSNLGKESDYQCSACKKDVGEDAFFCQWCGERVDDTDESGSDAFKEPVNRRGFISMIIKTVLGIVAIVLSISAMAFGKAFARAAGPSLVFVVGGAFVAYWISKKVVKPESKPMVIAFSIQAGYFFALLVSSVLVFTSDVQDTVIVQTVIQLAVMAVGLVWLITRPGWYSVLFLTAFHIVISIIHIIAFETLRTAGMGNQVLLVHMFLRGAAVIAMFVGLYEMGKFGKDKTFCPHCDEVVPRDSLNCPSCGSSISEDTKKSDTA